MGKLPAVVDEHTLEISRMLTVSTCHVSKETRDQLPTCAAEMDTHLNVPRWGPEFARDSGWLFYVPLEKMAFETAYENAPKDLTDVLLFAQQQGCEWLLFDSDGPVVEGLFVYEW